MPKDNSIKKVLVIGSGPIVIGQAAEFDYAGTQACRALKENNVSVVLVNSNPATIMTDKEMADKVYLEPLKIDVIKNIIEIEKPDSILPTLGGQTGLNLAVELAESGYLDEKGIRLLGTTVDTIKKAEDREMFKDTMISIGEPIIESVIASTVEEAVEFARTHGYPVIIRPAYTLGGTGGGFADNEEELLEVAAAGLRASRVTQVLVEKSVSGWKEIEFEVMRDSSGKAIIVCDMENIDPVGVHTGDSIVVAPTMTLSKKQLDMLENSALKIIGALGIEGGCNVQYALHPDTDQYYLIEVNPRVSRSSALASKATGYPIARVASLVAIGYRLDEIANKNTGVVFADKSPNVNYVVCKFPRFPFDKFTKADKKLGTKMKATGEVMSIGKNFETSFLKSIRGLELGVSKAQLPKFAEYSKDQIIAQLSVINHERIFCVLEALRKNVSIEKIYEITKINPWFLEKMRGIIVMEETIQKEGIKHLSKENLALFKKYGFADKTLAILCGVEESEIKALRTKFGIAAKYKVIDLCGKDGVAGSAYYYSTYEGEDESRAEGDTRKKIAVLGSGPIRIGQGVEFDYCSVHCVWALKKAGYETIIINNNPETVSTDFDTADKLYFEPLTAEEVINILELEKPEGVVVQFGGQTAIKLTKAVADAGYRIIGTQPDSIDRAEDRELFDELLSGLNMERPKGQTVFTEEEAVKAATELGYPVLVRPSYVLGGQGMEIAYSEADIREYMAIINTVEQTHPILVDKYIMGMEVEVDAICDGKEILIPGIMEHVERAGVHSGDSISVYPSLHISEEKTEEIKNITKQLAVALDTRGLINIQYIIANDKLYLIEVNPRSSRTVPYISKVTGIPMVQLAVKCALGESVEAQGYGTGIYKRSSIYAVKVPVFSSEKIPDLEISSSPEMKSTGEVLGLSADFREALLKGLIASGINVGKNSGVVVSVSDVFKNEVVEIVKQLKDMDYTVYATKGTAKALSEHGIDTVLVGKLADENKMDIVDIIKQGLVSLVINTPTKGRESGRDGFKIRRTAVEHGLPCLTSIDTAKALVGALKLNKTEKELKPIALQEI